MLTLTEADLVAAHQAWFRASLSTRRLVLSYLAVWLIWIAVGLWAMPRLGLGATALLIVLITTLWGLFVASLLWVQALLIPRRARKAYAQHRALHAPLKISWSSTGIDFETDSGFSRHPWSDFRKWTEDSAVFLTFQTDQLFNIIPKRVLGGAESADLRDCLAAARVPKARNVGLRGA